ncbi:MAG: GTP pyrophosphokinase family protein [Oscillospiraceae bacterium]|nr:GTP pyrophosphokinase family protein [Oscillospiraceae bacterium]
MEQTANHKESIYGSRLPEMEAVLADIQRRIEDLRAKMLHETGMDPVEHCLGRIKSEESMREKCRRQGLPETEESALVTIRDAIGFRIVCAFLSDVYRIRDHLARESGLTVVSEKDYIRSAKPNGYRSLHLITQAPGGLFVEFQLRTISMDTWAALEHHLKYKKTVSGNTELIVAELKRCAEELASTDVSMQTLRDMILT